MDLQEELEVIASDSGLWKKLSGLDALFENYGLDGKENNLAILR